MMEVMKMRVHKRRDSRTFQVIVTCFLFSLALFTAFASGQTTEGLNVSTKIDEAFGIHTIPLWPVSPTQAKKLDQDDEPTLTIFSPQKGRSNGTAVIVAPGGAYTGLAINIEGRQVADWFTGRGITAFVLKYRYGRKNLFPVPLQDGQQAVRLVRSLATSYGISTDKVGMIGFSAGGHLAANVGTLYHDEDMTISGLKSFSDRPDFMILGYPWLNAMEPSDGPHITYCAVLDNVPPKDCKTFDEQYSPASHVSSHTPPTFIFSTSDDKVVPIRASIVFYSALVAAGVPAEIHIFRHGAHGSGLGSGDQTLDIWPELLEKWLRDLGLLNNLTDKVDRRE